MSETIVFFGSGPVAAESLRRLAKNFTIEAVITKPRPAHHKGSVPVLEVAEEQGLPIFTAIDKKSLDDLFQTKPVKSRVAVLIDFGIIVSQKVIDYFPQGIINSHFSLLPEWRGADPITFSILSGQKQTGVSLMLLTAGMDEGPLLAQGKTDLADSPTTPELTQHLIKLSDALLTHMLPLYIEGKAILVDQLAATDQDQEPTYSRKLSKEDSVLNWRKSAAQLEREVRAFLDWPKSKTNFGSLNVVITKAHIADKNGQAGTRTVIDKKPAIYCGRQALVIDMLKPAGKKEMTGESFLAGYKQIFLG